MDQQNSRAFERAFETADCEDLIGAVQAWAGKSYRTPENVLEVMPCVVSGMHAFFTRKEDEARKAWKTGEAEAWRQARQSFDAGTRAFIDALALQANPDTQEPAKAPSPWGNTAATRPAIGAGWGPRHDA